MHETVGAEVLKMSRNQDYHGGRKEIILIVIFEPIESNLAIALIVGGHHS